MTVYDLIEKHEGRKLKPYKCPAGKNTIGIGGIRCKVQDSGKTEYYYKGEWLQDGCVFVEIEKKQWRVMTPNRVDQLYRRLKDDN